MVQDNYINLYIIWKGILWSFQKYTVLLLKNKFLRSYACLKNYTTQMYWVSLTRNFVVSTFGALCNEWSCLLYTLARLFKLLNIRFDFLTNSDNVHWNFPKANSQNPQAKIRKNDEINGNITQWLKLKLNKESVTDLA